MTGELKDYFNAEYRFFLDNAQYQRIDTPVIEPPALDITDRYQVDEKDNSVILTITRFISFNPPSLFELKVSFGAILTKKKELDLSTEELEKAFHDNGDFVTGNLLSRISFLVSSITASYGQPPLVSPAQSKVETE